MKKVQKKCNRPEIKSLVSIRYKVSVLNPDGSIALEKPWKKNLVLDQGLNAMVNLSVCELWNVAVVGDGITPVRRDSAAVTLSRSGNTVTASAPFFGSGDVGRLIKFDSGEEEYITSFADTTHVNTVNSGTIAATPGTVWYVNQTGLDSELKRTLTKTTDSGDNETTFLTDTFTHQRTFLFSAEVGSVTYNEIGWSHTLTVAGNLFGRDIIPGGIALTTGQQLKVVVQMTTSVSPTAPAAASDVGTGFDSSGDLMLESVCRAVSAIDTSSGGATLFNNSGAANGTVILEAASNVPEPTMYVTALLGDWTQQASIQTAAVSVPAVPTVSVAMTSVGYTSGNFYLDYTGTFSVVQAVGDIYGFNFTGGNGAGGATNRLLVTLHLDTPLSKDNEHTLTLTFRKIWGRVLVN